MIDMRGIGNKMKLVEWTHLVEERAASGKSVTAWCEEQGIARRIFYYWRQRVREAAVEGAIMTCQGMAPPPGVEGYPPFPVIESATPEFARIKVEGICTGATPGPARAGAKGASCVPAMSIRIGMAECEVYNGADTDIVERALLTLGKL